MPDETPDWIETVVRLATSLGFNGMRVRWKLIAWQKSWQRTHRNAERETAHLKYEHAVCPQCGRVQDKTERKCVKCGESMTPRPFQMLRRVGVVIPNFLSVSTMIGVLLLVTYFRLMLARPGSGYFSADTDLLVRFGAYWLPAIRAGEYWRYGTAIFLHIGLWHLGFNMLALAQVGPAVEQTFGRGRTLFFFMLTGVASFAACHAWGMQAPSAGASGAVMGLIGVAAGWGQRDGTTAGRTVRNQMLKWLVYTTIFGVFFNANHVAHFAGFVLGAVLGYFTPSRWLRRDVLRPADLALGAIGFAAAIATAVLVVRPPAGPVWIQPRTQAAAEDTLDDDETPEELAAWFRASARACALRAQGKAEEGLALLRKELPRDVKPESFTDDQFAAQCQAHKRMVEFCNKPRDAGPPARQFKLRWGGYASPAAETDDLNREFCAMLQVPAHTEPDAGED
jgi:membrane associated rhomboid family serine protease